MLLKFLCGRYARSDAAMLVGIVAAMMTRSSSDLVGIGALIEAQQNGSVGMEGEN